MTTPATPQAELYFAPNGKHVVVFSGQERFNGWICEWEDGPFSTLRPLKQLSKFPLPPGFDVVAAIRKGTRIRAVADGEGGAE